MVLSVSSDGQINVSPTARSSQRVRNITWPARPLRCELNWTTGHEEGVTSWSVKRTPVESDHIRTAHFMQHSALAGMATKTRWKYQKDKAFFFSDLYSHIYVQSDLVYPNSSVPIKMCSDSEICGLLNNF